MDEERINAEAKLETGGLHSLPRQKVRMTLAGVLLAMFLGSLSQTIISTAMPRIITDLGGFTQYTWVATVYMIAATIAVPVVGRMSDLYGRKWFLVGGVAVFIFGSLLCGFSQNMTQLIIFRAIAGFGFGSINGLVMIVVGDIFPPSERGKYQGLTAAVFGLSSVIGPTLGGFITDNLSWHWVFFVNVPFGVLVIFLLTTFFPYLRPDELKHKVDYLGVAVLTLAVMPAMLALSWAGVDYPWMSARIIGLFLFSLAMLALFVRIENRSDEPIIPLAIFKDRIVSVATVVIFISGFSMFGGIIFVPLYFQGVLGASATASGSFLTPMMLGMVAGSILSGQILSRMGGHYRIQGMVGLALIALGLGLLSSMTVETSYAAAVFNIILVGFGLGTTMPLYIIAVQNAVPYALLGAATSATAFSRQLGGAFGLAIFGSVMNNRFYSDFNGGLSPAARDVISPETLNTLAKNPQALLSPEAEAELRGVFEPLGAQGQVLFEQVMETLRHALNSGITRVFFIGFAVVLVAWLANLFLKEVPLRKRHI